MYALYYDWYFEIPANGGSDGAIRSYGMVWYVWYYSISCRTGDTMYNLQYEMVQDRKIDNSEEYNQNPMHSDGSWRSGEPQKMTFLGRLNPWPR